MTFTNEQIKILDQAKPHFESSRRGYIRNVPRWLTQQVIDVYEVATGKTILHKDISCSVCVLRIYQIIGQAYFRDIEDKNSKMIENEETNDTKPNIRDKEKATRNNRLDKKGKTKIKNIKRPNNQI